MFRKNYYVSPEAKKNTVARDRNKAYKRLYGLTLEQYAKLSASQGNVCKICAKKNIRSGKLIELAVDHCHKTGRIRGLLCNRCNLWIGNIKDSPELAQSAAKYLTEVQNGFFDRGHRYGNGNSFMR